MILVVGQAAKWEALSGAAPDGQELRFAGFGELTAALVRRLRPAMVVAPLVGPDFDAVDVAHLLAAAGFRGRLIVTAPTLPDVELIRQEIKGADGEFEVEIIVLAPRPI